MSGTVTAEVGRGHGRGGLCHSGRAGCGLGLAGGGEGSSCSVDKGEEEGVVDLGEVLLYSTYRLRPLSSTRFPVRSAAIDEWGG